MKNIFTLCVFVCSSILTRSQAVLNEVYPQPGNGYNEFFELYNENNSLEYLDNYTIIAYYEESGSKTGFYVLDLPNDSINAHGYYVSASLTPFNIQGQLGLTANSNWNALSTGGSLTKWESDGTTYTSVSVPANLNDLFVKIVGPGGVFHIFVYKNGMIVNGIVAGLNTTVIPAYIKAMPNLPVDMSGSSPDFTIDFGAIPDNSIEYLSNSAGTNNGYYRSADGLCGEWLKSDMPGQHNPNLTNGTSSNLANQLAISAVISQYAGDPTKSLLTYNITAGPAGAFPVIVDVYMDLGILRQLDVNDVLFDSRTINDPSAGIQNIILPSWDTQVILVLRTATDCYNTTIAVPNFWSVLPVQLLIFQGNFDRDNKVSLEWKVAENEDVNLFEVQRSTNGTEFRTIKLIYASEKNGTENYSFQEMVITDKVMYRLKMTDKNQHTDYSKVLLLQSNAKTASNIRIIGNPVRDKLNFSFTSTTAQVVVINIYDISGKLMMNSKMNSYEGSNMFSLLLTSSFRPGMFVAEIIAGTERSTSKFIKL